MGFSLKKAVKAAVKVVSAPVVAAVSVPIKIADKVGVSKVVQSTVGVDLNNISKVVQATGKLEGSTGSDEFKNALFDTAKIGLAAAGGTGAIADTTAAGGFLLASKAQAGGGISVGDLAAVAGVPTSFGGIDVGDIGIVKPKSIPQTIAEVPAYVEEAVRDSISNVYEAATAPKNKMFLYIGLGVTALISVLLILRKFKR